MLALCSACAGGGSILGNRSGASGETRRLLLASEAADDDEDATIDGWLKRPSTFSTWLWQSRFVRLEEGPRLLSFYRSHIWQGCRRDAAFDLTCLVNSHSMSRWGNRSAYLTLEFVKHSQNVISDREAIEVVKLKVPGGIDTARLWEHHLLASLEEQLLEACEHCVATELAANRALQILMRLHTAPADSRPRINVDKRRKPSTGQTALMLAAAAGHMKICALLLLAKADFTAVDIDGNSARYLAEEAGHAEVISLFAGGTQGALAACPEVQKDILGRSADDDTLINRA